LFEKVGGFGVFLFAYSMMAAIYAGGSYIFFPY